MDIHISEMMLVVIVLAITFNIGMVLCYLDARNRCNERG